MVLEEQRRGKRRRSRGLLGLFFIQAGVTHFVIPGSYERIVPPGWGDPKTLVKVSGVAEVVGGMGVLVPRTRPLAGLGLVALLLAVFPANVYMALQPERFRRIPRWALYARLPLQPLMMRWAWRATRG
ncbi:MAG TPA: DoxX family protein [Solirubrobacteraceae bacterium]|jgi:uncharacterized membrane protein